MYVLLSLYAFELIFLWFFIAFKEESSLCGRNPANDPKRCQQKSLKWSESYQWFRESHEPRTNSQDAHSKQRSSCVCWSGGRGVGTRAVRWALEYIWVYSKVWFWLLILQLRIKFCNRIKKFGKKCNLNDYLYTKVIILAYFNFRANKKPHPPNTRHTVPKWGLLPCEVVDRRWKDFLVVEKLIFLTFGPNYCNPIRASPVFNLFVCGISPCLSVRGLFLSLGQVDWYPITVS